MAKISDSPGPGKYDHKSTNEGPQITLKGRDFAKERDVVPGPGQYERPPETVSPSYRLGSAPRLGIFKKKAGPGPGSYKALDLSLIHI